MQRKLLLCSLLLVSVYCGHERRERIRSLTEMINYPDVQESYFRTNKMYTFRYDGQINIGVPDHSDQQSASRVQAEVTLVKRSDEHFIIRVRDVRIGKQLSRIQDPRQIQSFEQFESAQIDRQEVSIMELPVEFTYADGQIQDLVFQQQEEEWSANMKRGIINMLQIKLQPKDRVSMEEEQSALNKLYTESKTDVAQVYRTNEKTVEGKCDTMYSVNTIQSQDDQSSSTMLVTKTIDLNSCQERPKYRTNFQFTQDCPSCPIHSSRDKSLQSSTVLRYQIRGKRDRFLVESVQMSNDHVYSAQNKDENSVVVTIRASLRLTSSQDASQQSMEMSEFPQTGQKVSDLIYSTESAEKLIRFQTQGDQHYPSEARRWLSRERNAETIFGETLMKMVRHMRSSIDEKASRKFYKLVSLVRMMRESEIKSIHQQYFTRHQSGQMTPEEREKIRNIMPHIYAQAGTYNAIRHLSEKISSGDISPTKATVVLPGMMNAPHVSKEMITEMLRLEQSSFVQQNRMLKKATWLTIGSMMRTACAKRRQMRHTTSDRMDMNRDRPEYMDSCGSDTEQRFVRIISERLRNSQTWEDKILYLRVLGNAGLESSIQEIERILSNSDQGERESSAIRMEAIMALRNLRQSLPQKTKSILLASAMNRMESSAVRMAAIHQLLQDKPGKLVIDQLASMVNQDSNRRVASFAYRLMKYISESKQPCYAEMNKDLRPAIKRVKRISANMPVSDVIFESIQDMDNKVGMDIFLLPFYESDEIAPKFIRAGINQMTRSRLIKNLIAVEMGTSGLSSILTDLVETIPDRQAGSVQYKLNLRRFADKIQRSPSKSDQPKSWISLKLKNQDVLLYTMNEQRLKQIFQSGNTNMIATLLSSLRFMSRSSGIDEATLLHETTLYVPTAMGSILRIKKKIPAMLSIHGQMRNEIQGSNKGRMDINAKLNAVISMVTDIRSKTPILSNGIYLIRTAKASLPIDIGVSVNPMQSDEQLKVEIRHTESNRDLIKVESRPVIYTKRFMQPISEDEEKTIVADRNTKMESFKECLQIPMFGYEACMRGLISKPSCEHNKLTHYIAPWFGPNKIVFSAYPTASGDNKVTLTGSVSRMSSGQSEQDESYRFTVKGQSNKQDLDVQISKSMDSIIPKQIKAHYKQSGQQGMEVCMQMNANRDGYQSADSYKSTSESRKLKIDAKINWGSSQCKPENYIQAKIETTIKPRMYIDQSRSLRQSDDQSASNYLTSRDETSSCKVQISHKNIPRSISRYGEKILDYMIYRNYWNTQIRRSDSTPSSSSSPRQEQDSIQMNIKNGKADIKIQTNRKTVIMEGVRIPRAIRYEKLARSNLVRLLNIMTNSHARASCSIWENSIRTFDNAVYRMPFSDCYTILAKDEASRVTVMAKRSRSQPEKKTVKVITPDHEIKLKPEHGATNIYIDGSKWQEDTFTDQRSMKISRSGRSASIKLIKQNVEISSDGDSITIQAPEKNHGQQQGMCGNLNADSSDDFGQQHSSHKKNVMQMWQQMTLADGSCQQPTDQDEMEFEHPIPYEQSEDDSDSDRRNVWSWNQKQDMDFTDSESESSPSRKWSGSQRDRNYHQSSDNLEVEDVLSEVAPIRQNKIVERNGRRCVSIRPVEQCPEHSYVADRGQMERDVEYTCLSRQDPLMSQFGHRRRHGHSMDLADREVSFSRRERIPRKCVAIV